MSKTFPPDYFPERNLEKYGERYHRQGLQYLGTVVCPHYRVMINEAQIHTDFQLSLKQRDDLSTEILTLNGKATTNSG